MMSTTIQSKHRLTNIISRAQNILYGMVNNLHLGVDFRHTSRVSLALQLLQQL